MSSVRELYKANLAFLTDLYELTMGAGYDAAGVADREAVFSLSFRDLPFDGGYAVAAGLDDALEILEHMRFEETDLDYLGGLRGPAGRPIFRSSFLDRLGSFRFTCDVDAIPEGTVVFPNEPLIRVRGPLLQAQMVESLLLTVIGFQTLVATKAARVVEAAAGAPILEFGLRRAQGPDGALSAARAAYIGGVAATSNVLAGRLFGIPVRGTHAHSWVQVFDDEQRAFDAVRRRSAGQRHSAGGHVRDAVRRQPCHRHRPPSQGSGRFAGRHQARFGRPGLPLDRGPADARRGRPDRDQDRRLERPRRAHHRVASRAGRAHRHLGRRHQA